MKRKRIRDRLCSALLYAYPGAVRSEYGADVRWIVRELAGRPEYRGAIGSARLGMFLVKDVVVSVARERVAAIPRRGVPMRSARPVARPPYMDALLAALAVLALYVATLAPTVAFWDTGEYMTAAHVRGIPHQPGNPLFVLLAHGWERLLSPFGLPAAVRLNLFSAMMSAGAHFFWFLVAHAALAEVTSDARIRRIGAFAAVLLSATAFTVWNQSNVNEKVYTVSLLTVALVSWLMMRWRDDARRPGWLLAIAFVIALTSTNHLMGALVAPAVLGFVVMVDRRVLLKPRLWAGGLLCIAVGLLPQFFLPYRSAQHPVLNEGDIRCESAASAALSVYSYGKVGCRTLSETLNREQYGKPPISVDPTVFPNEQLPRGPFLVSRQLANYAQYFNWQWGRSIAGQDPLVGGLRPMVTLIFLLLGCLGAYRHWRRDRAGAVYFGVLFLTLSLGLVVYLNFKYGFSIENRVFPDREMHEVRERDYFFLISFSVWGLWAGLGLVALWQMAADALREVVRLPQLAAAPVFALALLPLGLNWQYASRADDYTARDFAYNVLMSVDPYGVLFTNGDNDTFPLWYLQEVEGIRRDVTVMVTGYLNTDWYARQVRDATRPCPQGVSSEDDPTRIICQRVYRPEQMPALLAGAKPSAPKDSILPFTDQQIDQIIAAPFITQETLTLEAGNIRSTIAAGTTMLPADTFVAAIVQASIGERPIHFTTPAPVAEKLGLFGHTVRQGLTFKLLNGDPAATAGSLVPMPNSDIGGALGAFVDVDGTETRMMNVFQQRGRILDPSQPWVDRATSNILLQYVWAHVALAEAHAIRGNRSAAQRHAAQAQWWQRIAAED